MKETLTKLINKIIIRKYRDIAPELSFEVMPASLEYDSMGVGENTYLVRFKFTDENDKFPSIVEKPLVKDTIFVMKSVGLKGVRHKQSNMTYFRGYVDIIGNN
jgi:hypothetical protein